MKVHCISILPDQHDEGQHKEEQFMKPKVSGKVMTGFRHELETQENIARRQRELEKAKEQLFKIRCERAGQTYICCIYLPL